MKREFAASHASADVMRYAGLVASILASGSSSVVGHIVLFSGLLFRPQQSADVVAPGSALNPAGHCVHAGAEAFENVSAGHVEHDVAASCV